MVEATNCGYCGHDCLGGPCVGGVCQPVVLASGQNQPNELTLDDTHVYWSTGGGGTVVKAPLDGGAPFTIVTGQNNPGVQAVDSASVYWTTWNDGTAAMAPLDGGTVLTFAHADGGISLGAMRVDARYAYWLYPDAANQRLMRAPLQAAVANLPAGTTVPSTTVLASTAYSYSAPGGLLLRGSTAYWGTWAGDPRGEAWSVPIGGGTTTTIISPQSVPLNLIGLEASSLCLWEGDSIVLMPLEGGASATLASGPNLGAEAVDSANVYWVTTGSSGTVMTMPLAGGSARTLASGLDNPTFGIAVDAHAVYWTNLDGGTVMKVAKP
jgi:hypothetical protein